MDQRSNGESEQGGFDSNSQGAEKILQAFETRLKLRKDYFKVAGFSIFAFAYLVALYYQGSSMYSYEVVQSLRSAFVVGDTMHSTFSSKDQLIAHIGNQMVLPVWVDPVCGDSRCQWPWEFPAFGRFGCQADCGEATDTVNVLVQIKANFANKMAMSPRMLMADVRWNLCLDDPARFEQDQKFTEVVESRLETFEVIKGRWFIKIKGDHTQRVSGRIFDISNSSNPIQIETTVIVYSQIPSSLVQNPASVERLQTPTEIFIKIEIRICQKIIKRLFQFCTRGVDTN